MNPITFDEFLRQELDRLDAFSRFWSQGMHQQPQHYPAEMLPGDWEEQLSLFLMSEGADL